MRPTLNYFCWTAAIAILSIAVGYGINAARPDSVPLSYVSAGTRLTEEIVQFLAGEPSGQPAVAPGHITRISLQQFDSLVATGDVLVVDARPDLFFRFGHIPDAISLPRKDFVEHYPTAGPRIDQAVQAGHTICLYCADEHCPDAGYVAAGLVQMGAPIQQIVVYENGWAEWESEGRQVISE